MKNHMKNPTPRTLSKHEILSEISDRFHDRLLIWSLSKRLWDVCEGKAVGCGGIKTFRPLSCQTRTCTHTRVHAHTGTSTAITSEVRRSRRCISLSVNLLRWSEAVWLVLTTDHTHTYSQTHIDKHTLPVIVAVSLSHTHTYAGALDTDLKQADCTVVLSIRAAN